jgi:hypothetical protein
VIRRVRKILTDATSHRAADSRDVDPYPARHPKDLEERRNLKLADVHKITHNPQARTAPAIQELLLRIEGEYREMPGLSLTMSQAERLWGLDRGTCNFVLTTLIELRVLKQTRMGTFLRGSARLTSHAGERSW